MAKVKNPLLSGDASGNFGKKMIFKRGGIVTRMFSPKNTRSEAQQAHRQAFRGYWMAGLTQAVADLLYAALGHLHDDRYIQSVPQQDHGGLAGLADDDHSQYYNQTRGDARYLRSVPQQDHGGLAGLGDDDHTQYYNQTRGDARYPLIDHTHAGSGMQLIEDKYLSAADANNFDFQSIPNSYKSLKIFFDGRSNRAAVSDSLLIKFNNDGGNNYVGLIQWGAGQTEQATAGGPPVFLYSAANTSPANWFSNCEITIADYANGNKFHGWQARGMEAPVNTAGTFYIYDAMGLYLSTTAISRVTLYPLTGTQFKRYSRAVLFGVY